MKKQGMATPTIILVIIGVLVICGGVWYMAQEPFPGQLTAAGCTVRGGEIVNTIGQPTYSQERYLGEVVGMMCPCVCLKKGNTSE